MFYRRKSWGWYPAVILLAALMLFGGCAGNRQSLERDGIVLKYKMPDNKVIKYRYDNAATQKMTVRDNPMTIEWAGMDAISIRPTGRASGGYALNVTFDSLDFKLTTPRGPIEPEMQPLCGKSFSMVLSPQGKESQVTSKEPLEVTLVATETHDVTTTYKAFFPDLPTRPLKIGDTWHSSDTVTESGASGTRTVILNSKNQLDGFETIGELRCARIVAEVTGTIEGAGQEAGVELITSGTITGTETWYFAYDEGLFVKTLSTGVGESTIVATSEDNMTIPVTREYTIVAELMR
jgi:hypothetical protein